MPLLGYAGSLLAREHQMRRRIRRGALDDTKAQLAQVQAGEERFPLAQHDWRKGQVHLVDQPGPQILPGRVHPPPIFTSLSPAAARACLSADSMPSVTKWKVVPPSSSIDARAWWVRM